MKNTRKTAFACALALLLSASLAACDPKTENQTTGEVAPAESATVTRDNPPTSPESETFFDDGTDEYRNKLIIYEGFSEKGIMTEADAHQRTPIYEEKDLAPFRPYFPELTDEAASKLLADKEGLTFVLEITQKNPKSYYSIDGIYQDIDQIRVEISEFCDPEDEAVQPAHTFYLIHVPGDVYEDEILNVIFIAQE